MLYADLTLVVRSSELLAVVTEAWRTIPFITTGKRDTETLLLSAEDVGDALTRLQTARVRAALLVLFAPPTHVGLAKRVVRVLTTHFHGFRRIHTFGSSIRFSGVYQSGSSSYSESGRRYSKNRRNYSKNRRRGGEALGLHYVR